MKVHGIFVVAIIVVAAFGALYLLAYYSPQFLRSPQLGFFRWGLYRQEIVELANEDTIAFTDRPQSLRLVFDVEEPVMYDEAAREGRGQKYLESIVLKYFDKIHLTLFYDDEEYPIDLFNLQPDYSTYVYYGDGIHVRVGSRVWPKEVRYRLMLDEPLEGTALYLIAGTPAGMSTP